ncbi:copia-type polyprotein, partial [Trifolium medium]|nr:copia-type polyprotein [Trifolium medium]
MCVVRWSQFDLEQNGKADGRNKTLMNMARCMLKGKDMPKQFRREAVFAAAYILNRSPTKTLHEVTPGAEWSGRKPA